MRRECWSATMLLVLAAATLDAQEQQADRAFEAWISHPAYSNGAGPRVVVDEAHHNFHTVSGRYAPFAHLLGKDGFVVRPSDAAFSARSLADVQLLVIANPLNAVNAPDKWILPTPSAFTPDEIAAVVDWVNAGGSLLLIADHMPFAGAAHDLAAAFGIEFLNGYAVAAPPDRPELFARGEGLASHPITLGRGGDAAVTMVRTFTGSAFRAAHAEPLITLGEGYQVFEPSDAGEITASTPKQPGRGLLQAAALRVGRGRIVVCGEAAMFTSQSAGSERVGFGAAGAEDNAQLLLNVVHWLVRRPGY